VSVDEVLILSTNDLNKRQRKSQSKIQTKSRKGKRCFWHGKQAENGREIFLK
jgi:hypothetical protein